VAFTQKLIGLNIQLAQGSQTGQPSTFTGTNSSSLSVVGQRTRVRIQNSGAPASNAAQVDVYGLLPSQMNDLSTLGMQINVIPKNTIAIAAGDAETGLSTVFTGTITNAYGDYNQAPNVPFHFECQFGLAQSAAPAAPTSYRGATSVVAVMQGLAQKLGCAFENNGVSGSLYGPYFAGSLMTQVAACREHAGIGAEFVPPIDSSGNPTLAIFPKLGGRTSQTSIPLLAPAPVGEMIGYPSFTQQGILVRNVFDPTVQFFGMVQVQSSLPQAEGTWVVHKLDHMLDAFYPDGLWESAIYCYSPNNPNPVLPPA